MQGQVGLRAHMHAEVEQVAQQLGQVLGRGLEQLLDLLLHVRAQAREQMLHVVGAELAEGAGAERQEIGTPSARLGLRATTTRELRNGLLERA
eukprot:15454816-Alexandrium_andersonii.AAC.1